MFTYRWTTCCLKPKESQFHSWTFSGLLDTHLGLLKERMPADHLLLFRWTETFIALMISFLLWIERNIFLFLINNE